MFSIATITQLLWTSFATSSYLVVFALAFALVLKVNRIFNFAQAALMIVAFYSAYTVVTLLGLPGAVGFAACVLATVLVALLLEVTGFRALRRRNASPLFVFIFTLMMSEFVAYMAMLIFGTWPATIFPSLFWPAFLVQNVAVSVWDGLALAAMAVSAAMLFLFLRFSSHGQFMMAVADNPDLAELYGMDKNMVYLLSMIAAAILIGVGMFLYGTRAQVQPTTSIDLMLFAVAATIIGGIGNLWGAAVTAIILGMVQNVSVLFIPSEWQGFLLYAFLFFAVVFFPNGIRMPERRRLSRRVASVDLDAVLPDVKGS
jgi:branched-subunit amino acid ABC-type transport system permease component